MKRLLIFKSVRTGEEIVLPVTPKEYAVDAGISVEPLDMQSYGVVNLPGLKTLLAQSISCMFPAQAYPFCNPGTVTDPFYYVNKFRGFAESGEVLRFVVSDTVINEPILIESITYGERDGTNDIYATIHIRGYRELTAPELERTAPEQNLPRASAPEKETAQQTYVVQTGDTLWSICKRFYGDGTLAWKLAARNGIANANLVFAGQILELPPLEELQATKAASTGGGSGGTSGGAEPEDPGTVQPETPSTREPVNEEEKYKLTVAFFGDAMKYGKVKVLVGGKELTEKSSSFTVMVTKYASVTIRWWGECGAVCERAYLPLSGTVITNLPGYTYTVYKDMGLTLRWVKGS